MPRNVRICRHRFRFKPLARQLPIHPTCPFPVSIVIYTRAGGQVLGWMTREFRLISGGQPVNRGMERSELERARGEPGRRGKSGRGRRDAALGGGAAALERSGAGRCGRALERASGARGRWSEPGRRDAALGAARQVILDILQNARKRGRGGKTRKINGYSNFYGHIHAIIGGGSKLIGLCLLT